MNHLKSMLAATLCAAVLAVSLLSGPSALADEKEKGKSSTTATHKMTGAHATSKKAAAHKKTSRKSAHKKSGKAKTNASTSGEKK